LKGVFRIVAVTENAATDLQHQGAMTVYQGGKSAVVFVRDEAFDQDGVAGGILLQRGRQPVDIPQYSVRSTRHDASRKQSEFRSILHYTALPQPKWTGYFRCVR
jgi:hypothetical protein